MEEERGLGRAEAEAEAGRNRNRARNPARDLANPAFAFRCCSERVK
jgi:hypothetical protein